MQVQDATLYHHGNPGGSTEKWSCVSPTFNLSVCEQLLPILSSNSAEDQPMFAIAMEVEADKEVRKARFRTFKHKVCYLQYKDSAEIKKFNASQNDFVITTF